MKFTIVKFLIKLYFLSILIINNTIIYGKQITTPKFQKDITNKNWQTRENAILTLSGKPNKNDIPVFLSLIKDKHRFVRLSALRAISKINEKWQYVKIKSLLNDRYWLIRLEAGRFLINKLQKQALPLILNLQKDKNPYVQREFISEVKRLTMKKKYPWSLGFSFNSDTTTYSSFTTLKYGVFINRSGPYQLRAHMRGGIAIQNNKDDPLGRILSEFDAALNFDCVNLIGKFTPFLISNIKFNQITRLWVDFNLGIGLKKIFFTGKVLQELSLSHAFLYNVEHFDKIENSINYGKIKKESIRGSLRFRFRLDIFKGILNIQHTSYYLPIFYNFLKLKSDFDDYKILNNLGIRLRLIRNVLYFKVTLLHEYNSKAFERGLDLNNYKTSASLEFKVKGLSFLFD